MTTVGNLLILSLTVFVHELGHYWQAKRCGLAVPEFSIGIGPKFFAFRRKETEIAFRMIPLLGYVELDPAGLKRLNRRQRIKVLLAGPLANLVYCLLLCVPLADGIEKMAKLLTVTVSIFFLAIPAALSAIFKLFISPIESMSSFAGPLTIIMGRESLGLPALSSSFADLLLYSYMLSLGIGSFNLLPLSVLDGGKIVQEFLTKDSWAEKFWKIGTSIIFALFLVYIISTDIYKLINKLLIG